MRRKEFSQSDTIRANMVLQTVALEFGVAPVDPACPQRRGSPQTAMARQIALYLFHTVFQMRMARVARAFQKHPTTARHACRIVEASREDPVLDARLSRLEAFLRQAPVPADAG